MRQSDLSRLDRIESKLDYIIRYLRVLAVMEVRMSGELEALAAQVQENTDVEQSALILIQGLADQLKAAGSDPAKLKELQAKLDASSGALAAAVAANTPTAPTPPVEEDSPAGSGNPPPTQ